jgi:hypothetical protein
VFPGNVVLKFGERRGRKSRYPTIALMPLAPSNGSTSWATHGQAEVSGRRRFATWDLSSCEASFPLSA